ncbi:hypothetical protein SULI_10585 [Saccharolobus solfataricus]|uniref:Uncharacterized protein n=3 Tax=Saccharolobus solfataricus TaxID=2287 RepID=Q97Z44_SACS2|nr:hypothetical protein [Saccharolobus solfataricus]AAK41352.1 Hypothetical protein SSO1092 [Saccharolobus solfataricus P2]AKA74294.1 hypothetical protein SULB_2099 [Saccharolobus solfataricus]AKA76990.1 hypothetical protein SULC_2097 [Saccharolobus solfataricus]AKA79682.1 hypothetical protein SULA_2098 [Saccharolobus solfataricus]AZF68777.1 hypothetical protein SULG_10585 [Saccharolobus solfataricus]
MKLNGIDISSIIAAETGYIITRYEFIDSFAEEFPAYVSYDLTNNALRKLIIFDPPKVGFNFYPNYKYKIKVKKSAETLYSLKGSDRVLIALKAYKKVIGEMNVLMTKLYFLGLKNGKPYRMLILNDVPIIASDKRELIDKLIGYLKENYNITVSNIPIIVDGIEYRERNDVRILDVDYATIIP